MIVYRGQVDTGLAGYHPEGGFSEPPLGEKLFCSIKNPVDCI
jgi:hypothetical protein